MRKNAMDGSDDARYRAKTYRNLSALFGNAPSADELGELIQMASATMNDGVKLRDYEERFYAYLAALAGRDHKELRRDVASEYAELFIGPRPPFAPYYESIYLGYPNRLFTNQTMAVQEFYKECGFTVIKSGRVPGDNIAYELELMALLAEREANLLESADDTESEVTTDIERTRRQQTTFINKHLGAWAGLLAARINEAPCANFYGALSRFTAAFIEEDKQNLTDMAASPTL